MSQFFKNLIGKSLLRKLICENICQNLTHQNFQGLLFFLDLLLFKIKNIKNNNKYIIKRSPLKILSKSIFFIKYTL